MKWYTLIENSVFLIRSKLHKYFIFWYGSILYELYELYGLYGFLEEGIVNLIQNTKLL